MKSTPVYSKSSVTLIDHMGTDVTVANSARVSFAKHSTSINGVTNEADTKLIGYLSKHNHWSPFAHTSIQLRVKAPIFVARQLAKHQVGFAWNEISRRYVDSEPEFYAFSEWRERSNDKKQGSGFPLTEEDTQVAGSLYANLMQSALCSYIALLDVVAPEQARAVLPVTVMTEWYWTGSLAGFARVCQLRQAPDTQAETRVIADEIARICSELFPVSFAALMNQ